MHEIFFRQLVLEDLAAYRRIRIECLEHYPHNFGTTPAEEINSKTLKLDKAITQPDNCNFAIGVFNAHQKLIGICGFLAETREKTKHRGEVVQMFVDPAYKGQGIGKALLQQVTEKAFSSGLIEQIILSAVFTLKSAGTITPVVSLYHNPKPCSDNAFQGKSIPGSILRAGATSL